MRGRSRAKLQRFYGVLNTDLNSFAGSSGLSLRSAFIEISDKCYLAEGKLYPA